MSGERLFKRAGGRVWYGWYYESGERIQRSTRCTDRRAAEAVVLRDPKFYTARTKRAVNSGGVS